MQPLILLVPFLATGKKLIQTPVVSAWSNNALIDPISR